MIDHSYTMIIEAEALKAQINFADNAIKHNELPVTDKAIESVDFTDEPPLKTLFGAAINYVTVTAMRALKKSLKNFIRQIKFTINTEFTKILVSIGIDEDNCIDRSDVTGFIRMEWDRIIILQNDINKELKIIKNGAMNRLRPQIYKDLDMRARLVGANFQRWIQHSQERELKVATVKENITKINRLISTLEVTERDITLLTSRVEKAKIDDQTAKNISELMNVITYCINSYGLIVNELSKSIHPIHRVTSNAIDTIKKINPKNWYDDDVDIKVINDVYKGVKK